MFPEPELPPTPSEPALPPADPPSNVVPLAAPDPSLDRAERARRNGARSRGPVTAMGKARSARNALKHGLTARHGVVLDGEDAPAFQAMAERLLADLAPAGELAVLPGGRPRRRDVAHRPRPPPRAPGLRRRRARPRQAEPGAALWRQRLARAVPRAARARPPRPPARHAGRRRPRAAMANPAALAPPRHRRWKPTRRWPAGRCPPAMAEPPMMVPTVAALAWGAGGPPPPPPGCLLVRPVPSHWSRSWYRHQADAFPGAELVAVAADGTIHALEAGAWVVQPPHLPPGARPPAAPAPAAEQAAVTAILAKPPTVPTPAVSAAHRPAPEPGLAGLTLRHGMTLASLTGTDTPPGHRPWPATAAEDSPRTAAPTPSDESQRRNEPSQPVDPQRFTSVPLAPESPPIALDPWSRMWGLTPPPSAHASRGTPPPPPAARIETGATATTSAPPAGSPAFTPPVLPIASDLANPPPAGAADPPPADTASGEHLPRSARHPGRRRRNHRRRGAACAARVGSPLGGLDPPATEVDR